MTPRSHILLASGPDSSIPLVHPIFNDVSEENNKEDASLSSPNKYSKSTDSYLHPLVASLISNCVRILCRLLAARPKTVILFTVLFLLPICSFYFFYPIEIESDIRRGFAQRNGRSVTEFKAFAEFFGVPYEGLEIWVVLATPKRSRGIETIVVNSTILHELDRLDKFVQNFSVPFKGNFVSLNDTHSGEHLNYLLDYLQSVYPMNGLPGVDINYPQATIFEHKLFLASHFFEVNKGMTIGSNNVPLQSAQYVSLWYMSNSPNYEERKKLEAVEFGLFEYFLRDNFSEHFSVEMFGDQVGNAEMLRGTYTALSVFVVGAILMILFMLFIFRHLTRTSRIWMTAGAIVSPLLAVLTTFSILGWMGIRLNTIMCITPFLVLGIGVDDAFLLLHHWGRAKREGILCSEKALRSVIIHIGPSMTVTSLTNTLAFSIGVLNPTPQLSSFCLCTALAVCLDFILELTIFTPIMVLHYKENNNVKNEKETSSLLSWEKYSEFVFSWRGRIFIIWTAIIMFFSAGVGLSLLIPTFEPAKTFPADSKLKQALWSFEHIQTEYWPVNFIAHNVPVTWEEVDQWENMLQRLENRPHCYGKERTINFLRSFYEEFSSQNASLSFEELPSFLEKRMIADRKIIQFHRENNTVVVDGANFVVNCRVFPLPTGATDWNRRAELVRSTRELVDAYPQFNVSIFDYDSTIYDIIISVKWELIQVVFVTFICMSIISLLSIPSFFGAGLASLSMLSISACMLGSLSLWGCSLDPIVMINVIMAIGFSVDFSVHICYHHYVATRNPIRERPQQRLTRILQAVGRPMFEASLSTIVCMLPLFHINIYVINAFAKTVCLVASIGLFHGLALLPLIISLLPHRLPKDDNQKKNCF